MKTGKQFLQLLSEYTDINHDKELDMQTYTEGQPVKVDDAYEPYAHRHGVVISRGDAADTYKVKFDNDETPVEIPHKHLMTYKITQESTHYILSHDGVLSEGNLTEDMDALCAFPKKIDAPELIRSYIFMEEMTQAQKDKREEIVMGLKKNKDELEKKYGDDWESVMYAIATKKAMGEAIEESAENIIYKHENHMGEITITKTHDGYFRVSQTNQYGEEINDQMFSDIKDAQEAVQMLQ